MKQNLSNGWIKWNRGGVDFMREYGLTYAAIVLAIYFAEHMNPDNNIFVGTQIDICSDLRMDPKTFRKCIAELSDKNIIEKSKCKNGVYSYRVNWMYAVARGSKSKEQLEEEE